MLEVKNLVKCYSTKGGVTVKALDDVSVQFPETGMVFLLGRSGSGKSTLLNVSGGLDKPDSGEIIVKGRSSKEFSSSDFDSYRNTYVGFIFQEYNILNEFTVEQNIALALQLQNKPNDKKAVEALLERVDLAGFGKRKPNTLSGGQKQRVAIARALIKEPEIIMADEPTGALDSNTGKQVFETLKKLSETKLVIVVSHDREFAEQYGDRIIELKDGQILTDVTKAFSEPMQVSQNVQMISDDTISIRNADEITESDIKNIVKMLKSSGGEAIISTSKREMKDVKCACRINDDGNKEFFKDTEKVEIKEYDGKKTKFIKSRLPMSHAVKMGASGLRTKPIRLIFTVLLSVVAFLMFGVVSTFMLYDSNYSVSEALKTADYPSITVKKYYKYVSQEYRIDNETGEQTLEYENENEYITRFGEQELKDKNASGGKYAGIFDFTDRRYDGQSSGLSVMLVNGGSAINANVGSKLTEYYPEGNIYGFTDCGEQYMSQNGFRVVAGKYPKDKTEIAIPEYVANMFANTEGSGVTESNQMVGKKIRISGSNAISSSEEFTVSGVYDVGEIPAKYDELKDANSTNLSKDERKKLVESLTDYLSYGYDTILYVTSDFYEEYKDGIYSENNNYIDTEHVQGLTVDRYDNREQNITEDWGIGLFTDNIVKENKDSFKFYNLDGTEKEFSLAHSQVYVPKSYIEQIKDGVIENHVSKIMSSYYEYDADAKVLFAQGSEMRVAWDNRYSENTVGEFEDVMNTWYPKLAEKYFYFETANGMRNVANHNYEDPTYAQFLSGTEFNELVVKIEKFVRNEEISEGVPAPAPTDDDWTALKNYVDTFVNKETTFGGFLQLHYYNLASEMMDVNNEVFEKLNSDDGAHYSFIMDQMYAGKATDEDFTKIKDFVDANYKSVIGQDVLTGADRFKVKKSGDIEIYYNSYKGSKGTLEVVGYYVLSADGADNYIVTENFVSSYGKRYKDENEFSWKHVDKTDYVAPTDAKYNYIITLTDNTQEEIALALTGDNVVSYGLTNSVYSQLNMFIEMIEEMQQIFLIIGIVFGVFAALMLLNFISVSISAKKKDIGILRAVGARGSDVFKIFFAEAFIIAVICFILATVGAYVVCNVLNTSMVTVVSMKLLDFNAINVALILLVSFTISLVATFFPVYMAAKKSPVESIRAL